MCWRPISLTFFIFTSQNHAQELPPSVQHDLSTYISLLRGALKSGSSSQISLAVQSAFFTDAEQSAIH